MVPWVSGQALEALLQRAIVIQSMEDPLTILSV